MDKELIKLLEELNTMLEEEIKSFEKSGVIEKRIEKAFKEKATISIKKFKGGSSEVSVEGSKLAVLITLAGLEKGIIEHFNVPTELWKMIKDMVGTKEAIENE